MRLFKRSKREVETEQKVETKENEVTDPLLKAILSSEDIDREKVMPMNVGDICEVLGQRRSNARRVLRELLNIKIDGVPVVYFAGNNLSEDTWRLFVSPNVYYGGEYGIQRKEVIENYKRLIDS